MLIVFNVIASHCSHKSIIVLLFACEELLRKRSQQRTFFFLFGVFPEPSRKFSGPSARTNRALERVESTASLSSRLAGNPSEALPSPLFYDHAVDPRRIQHTTGKAIFCPAVRRKFSYYSFRQSAEDQATTSSGSPPSDPPRTKSPSVRHSAEDQPSSVRPSADKEAIRSAVRRRPSHLQSGRPPTNKPSVRQSAEDQAISSQAVRRQTSHPFGSPPKTKPSPVRPSADQQATLSTVRRKLSHFPSGSPPSTKLH
ncbi:uncharacterized protein LOC5571546 [Aedes aegypti]|uniref:Uncharacterized protein n=1 Tax=Aedes aegypti TaxID=7159 RepID=A0A6I8TST0_AEDAE|nr:uncharacterized protein LOC5571546 [Aedes aegypti]